MKPSFMLRRTMILATLLACALGAGCRKYPTIWSATSLSSDGRWIAVAHTVQYTGPGTDSVETVVEIKDLKRNALSRRSERVLGFANDGASMGLKMTWVTPSRLEVVFRDDPNVLYYQVVRTSGIEISVRDLSKEPSKDNHIY